MIQWVWSIYVIENVVSCLSSSSLLNDCPGVDPDVRSETVNSVS
jgi:hypothetical protein